VGLDLDSRTPSARSFRDNRFLAEPYFAAHHVSVKSGEQVVFMVRAFTSKCYCEWELLVEAVVDGKDQVFTVKDGGQPFRTTALATAYKTIYSFDFFGGNRFVKQPPGTKFPPPSLAHEDHAAFHGRRPVRPRKRMTAPLVSAVLSSA
jgi:hypothetical protein